MSYIVRCSITVYEAVHISLKPYQIKSKLHKMHYLKYNFANNTLHISSDIQINQLNEKLRRNCFIRINKGSNKINKPATFDGKTYNIYYAMPNEIIQY